MQHFLGMCGRYHWLAERETPDCIHRNSYTAFVHQHQLGKIYHCIGVVDDFLVLQAKRSTSFKVKAVHFQPLAASAFYMGDAVRVLNGSLQDQMAVIQGIGWHSKHQKLIFILYAQHKRCSRWYFAEDIAPAFV